jgi:AcrR family transcriptional regulator
VSTAPPRRKYEQTARAQSQERTREALLAAATDAFFGDRWRKTSLNMLAQAAGVTKQTLLRHFGSKDGLLLHAFMRGSIAVRDQRWSAPQGDIAGTVENVVEHYEAWGERSMKVGAWQSRTGSLAQLSAAARQFHYDWVDYAFAPWLERLAEPEHARSRAILISLCDVQTWWILSHDLGLDHDEVVATLTSALERQLEGERG